MGEAAQTVKHRDAKGGKLSLSMAADKIAFELNNALRSSDGTLPSFVLDCSKKLYNPEMYEKLRNEGIDEQESQRRSEVFRLKAHFEKAFTSVKRPNEILVRVNTLASYSDISASAGRNITYNFNPAYGYLDIASLKLVEDGTVRVTIHDRKAHGMLFGAEDKLTIKLESIISEKRVELSIASWNFDEQGIAGRIKTFVSGLRDRARRPATTRVSAQAQ